MTAQREINYGRLGIEIPKGLLRHKFDPPVLGPGFDLSLAQREPLLHFSEWKACLVSACPGYGKTFMLSKMYKQLELMPQCTPLWITLDSKDALPSRFVKALGYCFSAIDSRFAEVTNDENNDYEAKLVDLLNLLEELTNEIGLVCLFLDDYNAVSNVNFIDDLIVFINKNTPECFSMVLAADSFNQRIYDLFLDGSVIELNMDSMRMDAVALKKYVSRVVIDASDVEVNELMQYFGYWPMAYQYMSLADRRAKDKDEAKEVFKSYCARFFRTRILDKLPDDEVEFLIRASLLEYMQPQACAVISSVVNGYEILNKLANGNQFCFYDEQRDAFYFEPLFRRYLNSELLHLPQNQVADLARKASSAYRALNRQDEYAKYLVMSSDPLFLIGSIKNSTDLKIDTEGQSPTEYFLNTPAERFSNDEFLLWCVIWSLVSAGVVSEADYWIERLSCCKGSVDSDAATEYAWAICLALMGDTEGSLAVIEGVSQREGESLPRAFRCLLTHMKGEDYERLGKLKESRELYQKGLSLAGRFNTNFYKLFDLYLLAHQYYLLGQFDEAFSYAQKGVSLANENSVIYGEFNTILASVYIERGDFEEGRKRLDTALSCVSLQSNIDMYVDTYITLARYHLSQGEIVESFAVISDLIDDITGRNVPRNLNISAYTLGVRLALAAGESVRAYSWKSKLEDFVDSKDVLRAIPSMMALASLYRYEENLNAALKMIESCEEKLNVCNSRYMSSMCFMLKAAIFSDLSKENEAMAAITHSLELSMRGGFFTVYCAADEKIYDLILKVAARQKGSSMIKAHAKRIIDAVNKQTQREVYAPAQSDTSGYFSLTERELEIMHLLNQGLTRTEIAQSQSVSQNTVKTHLKNIYSKLGVHSRSEVLRIAKENE